MLTTILLSTIIAICAGTFWVQKNNGPIGIKKRLGYALLVLTICGGLGMAEMYLNRFPLIMIFAVLQIFVLLVGLVHYKVIQQFDQDIKNRFILSEFFFTVMLTSMGVIVFVLVFNWHNVNGLGPLFSKVFLLLPLPFLIMQTYHLWKLVPPPKYQLWFYPRSKTLPLIELGENIVQVNFKFKRKPLENSFTKTPVRVPSNKSLGDLFHYFVHRHNTEKSFDHPIVIGEDGELYGWLFYQPVGWTPFRKYLDPNLTLLENKLGKYSTIVAVQVSDSKRLNKENKDGFFIKELQHRNNGLQKSKQEIS